MPTVVQFIHYGDQYVINHQNLQQFYNYTNGNGVLYWNNGQHHRKFLRSSGDCIDKIEVDHPQEDLLFWGEWEPHSMFTILNNPPNQHNLPHHIHRPIYCMQKMGNQNTDPLVFGDRFYYSNCQQKFRIMKHLTPGSIILFGTQFGYSKKNNANTYFVVDTVFVVKERIDYKITNKQVVFQNNPNLNISPILLDCALNRLGDGKYVLYLGATKNEPEDGMFSYAPCKRVSDANLQNGFERVKFYTGANHNQYSNNFYLPDLQIITQNLGVLDLNIANVVDFYNRLKVKILDQDFCLGHRFDSPPIQQTV